MVSNRDTQITQRVHLRSPPRHRALRQTRLRFPPRHRASRQTHLASATDQARRRQQQLHPFIKNWGDCIKPKRREHIRIGFGNIDGLDTEILNNTSVKIIKGFLRKYEIDVFGAAEININWNWTSCLALRSYLNFCGCSGPSSSTIGSISF